MYVWFINNMERLSNKKVRKLSNFAITIIVVVVLVFTGVLGFLSWYFYDMIKHKPSASVLGDKFGTFAFAPVTTGIGANFDDFSNRFQMYSSEIEAGMKENATSDEKKLATYIIYRIGCLATDKAMHYAKYVVGSGVAKGVVGGSGIKNVEVEGKINICSSYYNLTWPQKKNANLSDIHNNYSKYQVSEEYTQVPDKGVSSNASIIADLGEPLIRKTLPFARRSILTPDNRVVCYGEPSSAVINEDGAYANFSTRTKYNVMSTDKFEETSLFVRKYPSGWGDSFGLEAYDASMFIINLDTIKGETVKITKHMGENLKGKEIPYYQVDFEIDCQTNKGSDKSATYYAEQFYTEMTPMEFKSYLRDYSLLYSGLTIGMTVFESGYFRTFSTGEKWDMNGKAKFVLTLDAHLASNNQTTEYFSYDKQTVWQGFSNRYFGDNSSVNLPRERLPFYSELKKYKPEKYGDYR